MTNTNGLDLRPFVKFDERGEIKQAGLQDAKFTQSEIDLGDYIAFGDAKLINELQTYRQYVEFGGPGEFTIVDRPLIDWDFDQTEVKTGEEATLRNLPAGEIEVIGPVMGKISHEGGDFKVGFTLPGEYIMKIRAFPYFPATLYLTVGV